MVPGVRLHCISSSYGDTKVLKDISLEVEEGTLVTLLGPSGSGKTTCLRIIAGFVKPTSGRVVLGGDDVTSIPPHRRNTAIVFQHYALFPHLTVVENVAYGLSVRKLPNAEVRMRTEEALRLVHLEGLNERYPKQLSGGQKQRVALARAVVIQPKVLLLDEPLGALDLKLREQLQLEIRRVQQALGITTLNVTHDQGEALSMSDRVAVMREGQVLQVDTPVRLYQTPNSVFVARFVGRMNLLEVTVTNLRDGVRVQASTHAGCGAQIIEVVGNENGFSVGDQGLVAFRPEDAQFGTDLVNQVPASVEKAIYRGDGWTVACTTLNGQSISVRVPAGTPVPASGENVTICWSPERCRLLKEELPTREGLQ
jgi:spermidine/putrescine ABC transporter ATP-binding subunit